MVLKVIGSSSAGNGYILENDREALLIEAGVRFSDVKKALGYNIRKVVGCVVSHEHKDHARYVEEVKAAGIPVLGGEGVNPTRVIEPRRGYRLGGFQVIPLPVEHDVPCYAFIVRHEYMGKLLFVTDTMTFNYRIDGLSHILIEANYSDSRLDENIEAGLLPESLRERIIRSHMEIGTTIDVLNSLDLSAVWNIVLVHLSEGNSDAADFIQRIEAETGRTATIAVPGLVMSMKNLPY